MDKMIQQQWNHDNEINIMGGKMRGFFEFKTKRPGFKPGLKPPEENINEKQKRTALRESEEIICPILKFVIGKSRKHLYWTAKKNITKQIKK